MNGTSPRSLSLSAACAVVIVVLSGAANAPLCRAQQIRFDALQQNVIANLGWGFFGVPGSFNDLDSDDAVLGGPFPRIVQISTQHVSENGDVVARSSGLQTPTGFSALGVSADDAPRYTAIFAQMETRFDLAVTNTSFTPAPVDLDFHLSRTHAQLIDETLNGIAQGSGHRAVVDFNLYTSRFSADPNSNEKWSWQVELDGGAAGASLNVVQVDPQMIGTPTLISPVTGGSQSLNADFEEFTGHLDFAPMAPGEQLLFHYFIFIRVELAAADASRHTGGAVTAGDPFNFNTDIPSTIGSDFVFTAGDFTTAPEPAGILAIPAIAIFASRMGRRRSRGGSNSNV